MPRGSISPELSPSLSSEHHERGAGAMFTPIVLPSLLEVAYGVGSVIIVPFLKVCDVYVFFYILMNSLSLDPGSLLICLRSIIAGSVFFLVVSSQC